jgi:hypothetical protein
MKLLAQGLEWKPTVSGKLIEKNVVHPFTFDSEIQYLSVTGLSFSAWIH